MLVNNIAKIIQVFLLVYGSSGFSSSWADLSWVSLNMTLSRVQEGSLIYDLSYLIHTKKSQLIFRVQVFLIVQMQVPISKIFIYQREMSSILYFAVLFKLVWQLITKTSLLFALWVYCSYIGPKLAHFWLLFINEWPIISKPDSEQGRVGKLGS